MSRIQYVVPCLAVLFIALVAAGAAPSRDALYQISTIDSLMAGLYDGTVKLGELTRHGDFGLGTFDKLDGEMIVLDGLVYQASADSTVRRAAGAVTTPFAAVTFFDTDRTATIAEETDLAAMRDYLDRLLPSLNLFYALRIDGTFKRVKTRSVPMQSKPYPKLVEVAARQPIAEFADVKGTVVAFRCPYYVRGVNVPGYHLHFLTADRKRGGHVLDCTVSNAMVKLDITSEFNLFLPKDERFYHTDFETDSSGDLKKVE